jgi:hypothetical protein
MSHQFDGTDCTWNGSSYDCQYGGTAPVWHDIDLHNNDPSLNGSDCTWNGKSYDCQYGSTSSESYGHDSNFGDPPKEFLIVRNIIISIMVIFFLFAIATISTICILSVKCANQRMNQNTDQLPAYSPEMIDTTPNYPTTSKSRAVASQGHETITARSADYARRTPQPHEQQLQPAVSDAIVFATDVVLVDPVPTVTAPPSTFDVNESEIVVNMDSHTDRANDVDIQDLGC